MKNAFFKARKNISIIDKKIAKLFSKRMSNIEKIADFKKEYALPITDKKREDDLLLNNSRNLPEEYQKYYVLMQKRIMDVSKKYQAKLINDDISILSDSSVYCIHIEKESLKKASQYINLCEKTLIITDNGVPTEYVDTVKSQCQNPFLYILPSGEKSKSIDEYVKIMTYLSTNNFTKNDKIVAIGGGMVGDISAFCASTYLRGIDFYNIPTTLLSMVDSSVGGKTAIDFNGIKNNIGTFYPPKFVLIDTNVLSTLDSRIYAEGLAEIIKIALCLDKEMFLNIENGFDIEKIIKKAVLLKANVVEQDEKDKNYRHVLNFGHTVGHGIESQLKLLHGESIALGMLAMSSDKIRERLQNLFAQYNLPTSIEASSEDVEKILYFISHDKKKENGIFNTIYVDEIGKYYEKEMSIDDLKSRLLTIVK